MKVNLQFQDEPGKNNYEFYLTLSANRQHSPSESRQKSEGTLTTTSSPSVTGIPKQ